MKEFGGYLPIELNHGKEWFTGDNILRLNCGRTAIVTAIKDAGYKKIHIPVYLCESVKDVLAKNEISYQFYNLDEQLLPIDVNLKENEGILVVNYFGIFSDERLQELSNKYKNVIIDNTQGFFAKPILEVYNVYSCRKFIGVSDGSYLIKDDIKSVDYEADKSAYRSSFLLSCIEEGTNGAYQENLKNEELIGETGLRQMSSLTQMILSSVNYENISQIRKRNYSILHSLLCELNEFPEADIEGGQVPMIYPFLYTGRDIRADVVRKRIYISHWWKWISEFPYANEFEKKMAKYLLPLPIDQRYGEEDMFTLAQSLKEILYHIDQRCCS